MQNLNASILCLFAKCKSVLQKKNVLKDLKRLPCDVFALNKGIPYLVSKGDFERSVTFKRQLHLLRQVHLQVPSISLR